MSEMEVYEPTVDELHSRALVRAESPAEFVTKAQEIAKSLMGVVEERQLYSVINGRRHPLVEAWTFLGSMMGAFGSSVYPVTEWTRPVMGSRDRGFQLDPTGEDVVGWEARVLAKTTDGAVVGASEAMCTRLESKWRSRDDYAIRSMAQTRATSKALRQPLGFLMQLAGYDPTPREEMPDPEPAPPPRAPLKDETMVALMAAVAACEAAEPTLWSPLVVMANATRKFGREITTFSQLGEDEAQMILGGAERWLSTYVANDVDIPFGENTQEGE